MYNSADAALESSDVDRKGWVGTRRRSTLSRLDSRGDTFVSEACSPRSKLKDKRPTSSEAVETKRSPRVKVKGVQTEVDQLKAKIAELEENHAEGQERARLMVEALEGEASEETLEALIQANYKAYFNSALSDVQVPTSPRKTSLTQPDLLDPSFVIPELPTLQFGSPDLNGPRPLLAGSPADIVKFLVNWNTDREFVARFFLFYRQFMTPQELLQHITETYASRDTSEDGTAVSLLYVQPVPGSSTVSQRVCYILKRWIEDYYDTDLEPDLDLRNDFAALAARVDSGLLTTLEAAITRNRETRRAACRAQGVSMPAIQIAQNLSFIPILSSSTGPVSLARMLTLIEARLFLKLEEIDFLSASKEDGKMRSSPVQSLTKRFNDTASWIASEIVTLPTTKERAKKITFFIEVAQEALEMHNFNLLMTVLAGVNFSAVQRLKKSWKGVPLKPIATFHELEEIMSSARNYGVYRSRFKAAPNPKMPYFGVFLRDLHFLDLANSTWIGEDKSIVDFGKLLSLRGLLDEVILCQNFCDYQFPIIEKLQGSLLKLPYLDEEWLHQRSVEAEPIQSNGGVNYLEPDMSLSPPGRSQNNLLATVRKSLAFVKGSNAEEEDPSPEPDRPGRISVVESPKK